MAAQKLETGKNCIGLLSDETDELRAADATPAGAHRVRDFVLDLMARNVQPPQRSEVVSLAPPRR